MLLSQKSRISKSLMILLAIVIATAGFMAAPLYGQDGKAFADTESNFHYEIENDSYGNGAYVYDYDGDASNVVIPASLGGAPVVSVDLDYMGIEAIDTSACPTLRYLSVGDNEINYLDVSRNSALRDLSCGYNNLQSLDVSGNPSLESLYFSSNQITSIDLSKNSALKYLSLHYNKLSALDVSANAILQSLYCSNNKLKSLNVSGNVALKYLDASSNELTSLIANKNPSLEVMTCSANELTTLDVSTLTNLRYLTCSKNLLKALNLNGNPFLEELYCRDNLLKDLNVSNLNQLADLYCINNRITNAATQQALIARFGRSNIMPQRDVNDLTVVGGSGSGAFKPGKVVNIKADLAPAGKVFDRWVTDAAGAIAPAGLTAEETAFTMPAADATVTATWKTLLTSADIQLTVEGKAQKGQTIAVSDKLWTGKQIRPAIAVKAGNTVLKEGTDYTVAFAANVAIGKATATITGQGAYTGTKTFTFKILPKKMSVKKLTAEKGQIKAVWTKAATTQKVTKIQQGHKDSASLQAEKREKVDDQNPGGQNRDTDHQESEKRSGVPVPASQLQDRGKGEVLQPLERHEDEQGCQISGRVSLIKQRARARCFMNDMNQRSETGHFAGHAVRRSADMPS